MQPTGAIDKKWDELRVAGALPSTTFDPDLEDLPAPARRFLARALPTGVVLSRGIELVMEGEIKLKKWLPFKASQILVAGTGFIWRPRVGSGVVRFSGHDILAPGAASMKFKLLGLVPVVNESGDQVHNSAIGRLAAETVAWLPQALTPQMGATWSPVDADSAIVSLPVLERMVDVAVQVRPDGSLERIALNRHGAPDGEEFGSYPFGGYVGSEMTLGGVQIAGSGNAGWWIDTPRQDEGEFFRYRIVTAQFLDRAAQPGSV
jgi:hypothetical protein